MTVVGERCQRRESSAQKQERGSRAVHSRNATAFNYHYSTLTMQRPSYPFTRYCKGVCYGTLLSIF
ncbi:MAG: hypothetical protein ACRCZB_08960 [Bacteroidales bacterium]